jgi:hypothetical protein
MIRLNQITIKINELPNATAKECDRFLTSSDSVRSKAFSANPGEMLVEPIANYLKRFRPLKSATATKK